MKQLHGLAFGPQKKESPAMRDPAAIDRLTRVAGLAMARRSVR
jgi:hypothetical protein